MTYGLHNVRNVFRVRAGSTSGVRDGILLHTHKWPVALMHLYDYTVGCHIAHALEFVIATLYYLLLWPRHFASASDGFGVWVAEVFAFNFAVEFLLYGFWHAALYTPSPHLHPYKYNPADQYALPNDAPNRPASAGVLGHRLLAPQLRREMLFTTLGFVQSAAVQCGMMWLMATGAVPVMLSASDSPGVFVAGLVAVTYWRELHFYLVHRLMHPWWSQGGGLANGDVGAFLYRWVHSLHHKSYNVGPWAGLSMHPVEHLLYYTVALFPLVLSVATHPLHFLYCKFHADIAPIGGHDGHAAPGGDAAFHHLHHARFECNYGVPLVPLDKLFGTWVDYDDVKRVGWRQAARGVGCEKRSGVATSPTK